MKLGSDRAGHIHHCSYPIVMWREELWVVQQDRYIAKFRMTHGNFCTRLFSTTVWKAPSDRDDSMERVKIPAVTAAPAVAISRRGPPRIIVWKFREFWNAQSFRDLSPLSTNSSAISISTSPPSTLNPEQNPKQTPSSIPNLHIHSFQHLWQEGSLGFQI